MTRTQPVFCEPTPTTMADWPRTVVGVALNDPRTLAALEENILLPPYKAAPRTSVLYIKPANTYMPCGASVPLDPDVTEVEIGACLGLVFGRRATRVKAQEAMDYLAGYRVVADLYIPHESFYRPPIKQKCRDGFCPMGLRMTPAVLDPDALNIEVRIDGRAVQRASTADLLRPAAELIAEVTAFMSFNANDVLLMGIPHGAPRAQAGQAVDVEIEGVDTLRFSLTS